jgi:hypothetical protein
VIHAGELGTRTATGKRRRTSFGFRAQESRRRWTLRRRVVLQRKKTAFKLDKMEITCYVPSSAICATFKTTSGDFQGAILEMSSLKCAYVGPIWMLCGQGRPVRWTVIVRKGSM